MNSEYWRDAVMGKAKVMGLPYIQFSLQINLAA